MLQDLSVIEIDQLLTEIGHVKDAGYRLATMTAEKVEEGIEITYHFDQNYQMKNIRIVAKPESTVPSIASYYFAAFLVENEIQDLFGITFENLPVNFNGHLYLTPGGPIAPFAN